MAEKSLIMGDSEGPFKRVESFEAVRTPSEWERAFMLEQSAAMEGSSGSAVSVTLPPPQRAESISNLQPDELEKLFMAQMAAAMGGDMVGDKNMAGEAPDENEKKSSASSKGKFPSPR